MFFERLEFDWPGVGDVDGDVGLLGERNPDFAWHVRRVAFLEQFGEEQIVARGGEDGIQHHLPGSAVVGMVDAIGGEQVLRVAGDQDIGFHLADDAHHVAAQVKVWDQRAVFSVQEVNRFCARLRQQLHVLPGVASRTVRLPECPGCDRCGLYRRRSAGNTVM